MLSIARKRTSPTKTTGLEIASAVRESLNANPDLHKLQFEMEKKQKIICKCPTTLDMLNRRILQWPSEAFLCTEDRQTPAVAAIVCAATERGATNFDRATASLESWLRESDCADMLSLVNMLDRGHLVSLSEPGLKMCSRQNIALNYPLLTHVHGSAWDTENAQMVSAIQRWYGDYVEQNYEEDDEPQLEDYVAEPEALVEPEGMLDLDKILTEDASMIHDRGQDGFFAELASENFVKIIGKEHVAETTIYTVLHPNGSTTYRRMAPDLLQHQEIIMEFERSQAHSSYLTTLNSYPTDDCLIKIIETERDNWGRDIEKYL